MDCFTNTSVCDVTEYPQSLLKINNDGIQVSVTYKKRWDDDFGARGWKLNATIDDPDIIASTRDTGTRINTCVFVHDVLDHFFSGFGVSGHRSEAMALIQLAKRTGSDPGPDYEQMVREDIINGRINGEGLLTFLPKTLKVMLSLRKDRTDKEKVAYLKKKLGETYFVEAMVKHFYELGAAGEKHADESWKKLGLKPEKRTAVGLALQDIINRVDSLAEESGVGKIEGDLIINNRKCVLNLAFGALEESFFVAMVA